MNYRKNKIPKPDSNKEPQLNERLKKVVAGYAAINCSYELSERDKQELIMEKYHEKFPDTYYYEIPKLIRVKVGNKPENYLCYVINEEVTDTVRFKKHTFNRTVGKHGIPTAEPVYDDYGTLTDMQITGFKSSYDIPFDVKKIQELIAGSRIPVKEMMLGKGSILGHGDFIEPP